MSSKESHSFSVFVACQIGIHGAIVLQHLIFLQRLSTDGWVKKSNKAMLEIYPYIKPKELRNVLDRFERDGITVSKIENALPADRTKSYHVTNFGLKIYGIEPFAQTANGMPETANPFAQRANDNVPKGQMLIKEYCSVNSSFVSEDAPAKNENLSTPNTPIARGENMPGRADAGPDWGGFPKANTSDELQSELSRIYRLYPQEWRNTKEATPAQTWPDDKIKAVVSNFCDWAISEGWERRTFRQINARLKRWFKDEPLMQRKPQQQESTRPLRPVKTA